MALEEASVYCARIVRRSRSNFRAAFRFLAPDQRRALAAVYAFSRQVDDLADGGLAEGDKREQLAFWQGQVAHPNGGTALHPVTRELHWAMRQFGILPRYFEELLEGVARDIAPEPFQTMQALLTYCYGVAGTVGLICLRIFGVEETPDARGAAIALGNALQLTNILRDLVTDARAGRVYLPQEDLRRFGVTAAQLSMAETASGLEALIAFEGERAEGFFAQAWPHIARDRRLRPARIMAAYYYELLRRIRRDPTRILRGRVSVPWWRKIKLCLQYASSVAGSPVCRRPSIAP
ncbi:MAG: squalene/phytoene synthase family protein, partial [Deltaproteobacteria bacterium]|nr:squalene/phytoene synthase family protein [Deltaproteobacteria bacterium]